MNSEALNQFLQPTQLPSEGSESARAPYYYAVLGDRSITVKAGAHSKAEITRKTFDGNDDLTRTLPNHDMHNWVAIQWDSDLYTYFPS